MSSRISDPFRRASPAAILVVVAVLVVLCPVCRTLSSVIIDLSFNRIENERKQTSGKSEPSAFVISLLSCFVRVRVLRICVRSQ
jgi:hypothetical protein